MRFVSTSLLLFCVIYVASSHASEPTPQVIRSAANRAVRLVQASQQGWYAKQSCSSCHNQLMPAMAFRAARRHGIEVNDAAARADALASLDYYSNVDRAVQYYHSIDTAMDDGFRLLAADAAGVRPSLTTAVYARYVATRQQPDGHWLTIDVRPPQANSYVTATAVCLRVLQIYSHDSLAEDTRGRVARAAEWLMTQQPRDTEERTYQLLGLAWAGAPHEVRDKLAAELAAAQRDDGGWSSVAGRASDAYSTGEALVALHEAGEVSITDRRWQRGLRFLLDAQQPDGSWHVVSRLVSPVQVSPPYFETGYPYGHDQFISLMGASWSIMALADALGDARAATVAPLAEAAPTGVEPWMETVLFGSAADVQRLLDNGFDPNTATKRGTTALMLAMPDARKAKLLIDRGANVNARASTHFSALLVAAQYPDSLPAIKMLLDHGAEVQSRKGAGKPIYNATGLTLAVMAGNAAAVPIFAARGDRFGEPYMFLGMIGQPAVLNTAAGGDVRTMTALLDAGMPVDFAGEDGVTLLGQAILGNRVEMTKLLIARGADVNHVDSYGLTPLLLAASVNYGDSRVIAILKQAGVKDARNKNGLTALDLARKYGHANLMASLQR